MQSFAAPHTRHKILSFFSNALLPAPFQTARGVYYHPLYHLVPALAPFYTDYEKQFNGAPAFLFLYNNVWIPFLAVAVYLAFCFWGPRLMRDRKPFDLKPALSAWNMCLSLVSAMGALRVGSHLLYLLSPWGGYSFRDTICEPPEATYADNATGLWCVVFTVSKLFELMDTVFVVLRKKPLIFLHWYHHATVLLCSWLGHITFTPALYFVGINFSIHAVMYMYFFLMTVHTQLPSWFNPKWLTVAQISQMFVGIYVIGASAYYKYFAPENGRGCAIEGEMILAISAMYATYLVLFVNFFWDRYFAKGSKEKKKGGKAAAAASSSHPHKKDLLSMKKLEGVMKEVLAAQQQGQGQGGEEFKDGMKMQKQQL